jgi:hypothetical protein
MKPYRIRLVGVLVLFLFAWSAGSARASLVLTAAGTSQGFTLTTFASNFPTSQGLGPLGIGFPTTGGVLVSDNAGNVRFFPTDTDNQNAASATVTATPGVGRAFDIAKSNGVLYLGQRDAGQIVQLNNNGTIGQTIVSGLATPHGIVTNPLNGHLIVASFTGNNVYDVDPIAKTANLLFHASLDGLTISPDGTVLYGAAAPQGVDKIIGYSLVAGSVGNVVFDSGTVPGDPDGTAIGFGPLSGNIFVNTNSGTVIEINLASKIQTTIATGGSRGDFVTVDPNDGSLLLTQTDSIARLSNNGNFLPTAPEPSSWVLFGGGVAAFLTWRARRRGARSDRAS